MTKKHIGWFIHTKLGDKMEQVMQYFGSNTKRQNLGVEQRNERGKEIYSMGL